MTTPPPPATNDLWTALAEERAWARRLAYQLVRDEDAADDLLQEAWMAALRRPPEADRSLRPWLTTVLRHLSASGHRAGRRRRALREAAAALEGEGAPSPEADLAAREAHRLLAATVERLPPALQETLRLRYAAGLEPAEIARAQGIPPGTVRWRLKAGLDELRSRLDEEHGGDRDRWRRSLLPLLPAAAIPPPGAPEAAAPGTRRGRRGRRAPGPAILRSLGPILGLGMLVAAALVVGRGARDPGRGSAPAGSVAARAPAPPPFAPPPPAAPPSAPASAPPIEGLLEDEAGRPIAGAEVTARAVNVWGTRFLPPPQVARTGPDGRFRIEPAATWALYEITAAGPGFEPPFAASASLGPNDPPPAPVRLRATRAAGPGRPPGPPGAVLLTGRVVEIGSGAPVPGAEIYLSSDIPPDRTYRVTADEGGRYAVRLHRQWFGVVTLRAEREGYAPGQVETVRPRRAPLTQDLRLLVEGRLVGRVVDPDGAPVPGAVVSLSAGEGPAGFDVGRGPTDADGRFDLRGLRPGRYRIEARHERLGGTHPDVVAVASGEVARATVLVTRMMVASGRVVDDLGAPVAGVGVSIDGRGATTDAAGAFSIEGILPGRRGLYVNGSWKGRPSKHLTVDVGEEGLRDRVVTLRRPATIVGQVLDERGSPVAKVSVTVERRDLELAAGRPAAYTDGNGRFEIVGVEPGQISVEARLDHDEPGDERRGEIGPLAIGPAERKELTLALAATLEIEGHLRGADGRPVAGGRVVLRHDRPGRPDDVAVTDADGHYRFTRLPPGRVSVGYVDGPGRVEGGSVVYEELHLTLRPGQPRTVVDLRAAPAAARLTGVILDPAGRPIPAARVTASREGRPRPGGPDAEDHTDDAGRFSFTGLPPGPYRIVVDHPRHPIAVRRGVPTGSDARITLPRAARLTGVVVDRSGAPRASYAIKASLLASGAAVDEAAATTELPIDDPLGGFTFDRLDAGRYALVVMTGDGLVGYAEASASTDGEGPPVRIVLEPGAEVSGAVVDATTGAPVGDAEVFVWGTPLRREVRTDQRGRFALGGLPRGQAFRILVAPPAPHQAEERRVPAAGSTRVDLGAIPVRRRPGGR